MQQPTQQTIFDAIRERRRNPKPATAPPMTTQVENLARCVEASGATICDFFAARTVGAIFNGNELTRHVIDHVGGNYSSPLRVMRDLNEKGVIGYELMSRPQSLYRITKLPEAERMAA